MYLLMRALAALMLFAWSDGSAQAETWRWTDNAGVVHFSDDQDRIPSRYRNKASVVKDGAPVNIMPAAKPPKRSVAEPAAAAARGAVDSGRKPDADKLGRARHDSHAESGRKNVKRWVNTAPAPTTPARDAQDRAEERIRRDRQAVDDAQLPARRAQDQAEENIRKAREKTMGH